MERLRELLTYKARLWLYVIASFVQLGFSSYQAAAGDWFAFGLLLVGSLVTSLAASKVDTGQEV